MLTSQINKIQVWIVFCKSRNSYKAIFWLIQAAECLFLGSKTWSTDKILAQVEHGIDDIQKKFKVPCPWVGMHADNTGLHSSFEY
jgi:hypothetical protein